MTEPILWIATANPSKVLEFKILFPEYEIKTLLDIPEYEDIIEDGATFQENAMIKAKDLALHVKGIAIGDDSGLSVDCLDGFPGIHSKRWAEPLTDFIEISQALLLRMQEYQDMKLRTARMSTAIAFYDAISQVEKVIYCEVNGRIAKEILGEKDKGFGYDHIFIPDPFTLTYAQMGLTTKNKNSSRQKAVDEFKEFIKNYKGE
ncbi:non-canonical purine NTP pyrophosphatase [Mesoplasma syrphidae]|uniref:Non-canonical purine NTP pyrophosphatase n=1 Tax=Mesoplasma syrphidae TaxID=225999 RepID=A0A2K9BUX6_9MOLU|nr:non-canonical purine NTP pyrophosphatase [Mesoplasma syrphidae]AUF83520.1 non-canonical purine NTP pyrophosphatase [Mesoplasma syrphidae]